MTSTPTLRPLVVQDALTGEVLMVGYSSPESESWTLRTGWIHFHSRSRNRLWLKGESSGNRLRLLRLLEDCDRDSLLALALPLGPVCHTGSPSCFRESSGIFLPILGELSQTIHDRHERPTEGSYTSLLFRERDLCLSKLVEEAEELALACRLESEERVAQEGADLLYHMLVSLESRGVPLRRVLEVLAKRRGWEV